MANNQSNVDPRYLTYNKDEVQALLDKVANPDMADEAEVRSIVTGYSASNN